MREWQGYLGPVHDRGVLEAELRRILGHATFGESVVPLCIPAFEGRFGEPYIFKTPHHPDYRRDGRERMVDIALSTAAAPTTFEAVERDGYTFVDGGIWANNPVMIGVTDALTCYAIDRRQLHVLSLGTGRARIRTTHALRTGGKFRWARHFVDAAMAAQSQNALGQAYLLLGKEHVIRLDAPETTEPVALDDIRRAIRELPGLANSVVETVGDHVATMFLK
ncbi:patatin-like phospholipase family protein [Jannaschia formosa]|uniref:patatin-like phospholipase family protein n=1 Tax=Jannaschia formosa TaxID=2259592 RepID=UPI000E1BB589|nr:patatin-like phospholipase family protein [Jannaschia formosa]TFL16054.1 patatin [Jannaschia formosa]